MLADTVTTTNIVRHSLASRLRPSPRYLLIIALPPVASIVEIAIAILITGNTIFRDESALLPMNLDIKMPSTIV